MSFLQPISKKDWNGFILTNKETQRKKKIHLLLSCGRFFSPEELDVLLADLAAKESLHSSTCWHFESLYLVTLNITP